MRTILIALSILLAGCQARPPIITTTTNRPSTNATAESEIAAMLATGEPTEPEAAMALGPGATATHSPVQSLAAVVQACATDSTAYAGLLLAWSTPNAAGATIDAMVARCSTICPDLFAVLTLRGWTALPVCPPPSTLLHLADLQYLGSFNVPGTNIKYTQNSDIAYVPGGTLLIFGSGSGGITRYSIPTTLAQSKIALQCPTATVLPGGTLNGGTSILPHTTVNPVSRFRMASCILDRLGNLWVGSYEYYDVSGGNPAPLCVALDALNTGLSTPNIQGAYYVNGWQSARSSTNQNGGAASLLPPAWAAKNLGAGEWIGTGGHSRDGCCGSGRGPNMYAVPVPSTWPAAQGQLAGSRVLAYYPSAGGAQKFTDYKPDNQYEAEWIWTKDGRQGVLVAGTQGTGPSYYGPGPACDPAKGYHANPYEPRMWMLDPKDIEAVLAGGNSWMPQPVEETNPLWAWQHPLDPGNDPNCKINWFGGMAWDWENERLYVLHEGYAVHVLEVR